MGFNLQQLDEIKNESAKLAKKGANSNEDFLKNYVIMPKEEGWVDVRFLPPNELLPALKGGFVQPTKLIKLSDGLGGERSYHTRREYNNGRWVSPSSEEDCPCTLHYNHLWSEINTLEKNGYQREAEAKKILARKLKPIDRFYFAVVEVARSDHEADSTLPKILSVGKGLFELVINAITGNEEAGIPKMGDITDWKTGRTLRIHKSLKGRGADAFPDYARSRFLDPAPFGSPEDHQRWLANRPDLAGLRKVLSYEELKEKLQIHLGVKKPDVSTAYNPDDFVVEKSVEKEQTFAKVENVAKVERPVEKAVEKVEEKVVEERDASADEVLVEDDFWKSLEDV